MRVEFVDRPDNSNNTQRNETRSFIDILDGAVRVDPKSGIRAAAGRREVPRGLVMLFAQD